MDSQFSILGDEHLARTLATVDDQTLIAAGIPAEYVLELRSGQRTVADGLEIQRKYREDNKIEFFRPNPPQRKLLDAWLKPRYSTCCITGSNQFGKTTSGVIIALSTLFGEYKWTDPPTKLPIFHDMPRKVRYVCQDFQKHAAGTVSPEVKKWWPKNRPYKPRNNQWCTFFWTDILSGSTLELMSAMQPSSVYAGWTGDLIVYDEPMSKKIYQECAPRLVARGGRELLCMTMLEDQAWIDQEIIKGVDEEGIPKMNIWSVDATIEDNIGYGITDDSAQGGKTAEQKIAEMGSKYEDDDPAKQTRMKGTPLYLSGLVFPKFKRQIHCIPRFSVPKDWIVDIAIDTHPKKKQSVLFQAVSDNDEQYLVDEIWEYHDYEQLGHEIGKRIQTKGYRVGEIIIDPLSKGTGNMRREDTVELLTAFDMIKDVLWSYGQMLRTAGPEKHMYKSGIVLVNKGLCGPNQQPSIFVFNDLSRTIKSCEKWAYMKDTEEPSHEDDDMPKNLCWLTLLDTVWYPVPVRKQANSNNLSWKTV
jgi:hypothetical protein